MFKSFPVLFSLSNNLGILQNNHFTESSLGSDRTYIATCIHAIMLINERSKVVLEVDLQRSTPRLVNYRIVE